METVKLMERSILTPKKPSTRRRMFLSNIDLGLVAFQESVAFFDPPKSRITFSESCRALRRAIRQLLVDYDFAAGRLVPSVEDGRRLEIDCNDAGLVFATATAECELSELGNLMLPKAEFRQFVAFLREENEDEMEIGELPLFFVQFTELKCGSIALGTRYNHCILDGVAIREIDLNIAAVTRGGALLLVPKPDRTIFRARNPPIVTHPHQEYSKGTETDNLYTVHRTKNAVFQQISVYSNTHLIHLPPKRIFTLKRAVVGDGKLSNCSTFEVIAAKIWKARSIALGMESEEISTVLFPVDARKRIQPPAPAGFAGNALIPGFARGKVKELREEEDHVVVKRVRKGVERVDDEYIRSSIDWLEVNGGVPCRENSFSLVAWWRLGLEEDEFVWGKLKCTTVVALKPGLVFLLPGPEGEGGLNVCLEMPADQLMVFQRLMMED